MSHPRPRAVWARMSLNNSCPSSVIGGGCAYSHASGLPMLCIPLPQRCQQCEHICSHLSTTPWLCFQDGSPMSHTLVLPCGSDSKPVHAQVVSQPHSLVVYSYIHTYVHIYMCAMPQQHPVVLWSYPFTHIPCPVTISWWHGHTCSHVSCFPGLSVG